MATRRRSAPKKGRGKSSVAARRRSATHRDAADEHAATELVMYIENTSDLSPDGPSGQGRSVLLNALRKWRKGTYDSALAVRLFEYLAEAGAKRYAKEMGSSEREWSTMFNPATRHEAAQQLEASFRNSAEHGEYDHVDTRIGHHSSEVNAASQPSGNYVGRRVEIVRVRPGSTYFKPGQFGHVVGQNQTGGMSLIDVNRDSRPGEIALLISKTRDSRGGALWFSMDGVRFTGGGREARETGLAERKFSMTYGELPPFEKFEHDVHTRINPETDEPYWPEGTTYPMELVSSREIELAQDFGGLDDFRTDRQKTGRHYGAFGFRGDERQIYDFLVFLMNQEDAYSGEEESPGSLASSIMYTLGYEWL